MYFETLFPKMFYLPHRIYCKAKNKRSIEKFRYGTMRGAWRSHVRLVPCVLQIRCTRTSVEETRTNALEKCPLYGSNI